MANTIQVIHPQGILDAARAESFRQQIIAPINQGASVVIIDFQEVTFMDSSGLGSLVVALKNARANGAKLVLVGINEQVRMLFELTSMDRVFTIHSSLDEFKNAFNLE